MQNQQALNLQKQTELKKGKRDDYEMNELLFAGMTGALPRRPYHIAPT